ncbi:hypothetical protein C8A05DRAFT_17599 [Staphylotrichum tortipilum]|uniref:Uncharacterized protein n=1 Tax=Staphylotrichum tortipilum TaxID=2831512 RepID=A0AAN6MH05_9PEZI|nr:hypothetical protein C8A05DRAFT_17599 [Staphylotrichum longicolle]
MPSLVATLPLLASILAVAGAAELPLTPRPSYPPSTPPALYQPPSIFKLTQVPSGPTVTGTATNPEKCSQVAARITPQLTAKPSYPPSLKLMADKMGGIDQDTCGDMDFNSKFKSADPGDLNRFTQARYTTFIVPIWAKIHQLWSACGEETRKMQAIAQDPCYRWALELSKSSNASVGGAAGPQDKGKPGVDNKKVDGPTGNIKISDLEAGGSSVSSTAAVGALGTLALLWIAVMV